MTKFRWGATQGQMSEGGEVTVWGTLGEQLDVQAKNLGFTDVTAMDGQVTIGSVGTTAAEVDVYSLSDPQHSHVTVTVTGGKIEEVRYSSGVYDEKVDADAEFEDLTTR
ncbi:MAG: hypothetical protein IPO88_20500 [Nannocystis sp.]|uniref:hypothetical protein n=1 Tax=Nannocystis sp. TaxID=1962667 RepID=UPI0024266494|nr:hypothetical protein [Nannocystis sp.]MBK9755839.1 hypothetical protein [Nannocystis sp.]